MFMAIYEEKTAPDGTKFKIQSIGQKWSLYVKEPINKSFKRIQTSYDAKFLSQVLHNQKEFKVNVLISPRRKLKKVV